MTTNQKQQPLPASAGPSPIAPPSANKSVSSRRATGSNSKQDRVLAMLRTKGGTTIAAIMKATDWQQHSARGFLAGVVRKKLGLNLVSDTSDRGRTYRIAAGKSAKKASASRKRHS